MAYVSLYRKYRSQTFGDLIGQDHVVRTLQNGITSGRIAHSYLFTGPRGTGKTSTARLLAKSLCCEKGPLAEPCNECDICLGITEGSCIDVVEMDAASQTGVDDVRETIIQVVNYMPAVARYKVFIIDEVHDLSPKAFDALLKTIEEPPPHMIFVLATTEYSKVPPTIRSRCQKFEFHRAGIHDLVNRLHHVIDAEGIQAEPSALEAIARMADGGFRDALTLLEQAIVSAPSGQIKLQDIYDQLGLITEEVTDRILNAISTGAVAELTTLLAEQTQVGRDPRAILESLLYRLADLTRIAFNVEQGGLVDASRQAASHDLAVRIGQHRLLTIRSALAEAHKVIRDISLPRLWLESEMIRISLGFEVSEERFQIGTPKAAHEHASTARGTQAAHRGHNGEKQPVHSNPQIQNAPETKRTAPEPPKEQTEISAVTVAATETAVAVIEPTGDPVLDRVIKIWLQALEKMPAGKGLHNKLSDARIVEFKNNVVTVEMARKLDLSWINEDPQAPGRQKFVSNLLKELSGEDWTIKYKAANGVTKPMATEAVELPAEGAKLASYANEVFGGKKNQ